MATSAYPASDGWHGQFKFSWLSTEAHRDKSCGEADHGYDTQRDPWHRHSPDAKRAAGPHQYKNFSEFRTRLPMIKNVLAIKMHVLAIPVFKCPF